MYYLLITESADERDMQIYGQPEVIYNSKIDLGLGIKMQGIIPLVTITIEEDDEQGRMTDNLIAEGATGLVVNTKIKKLLSTSGVDNIQYFDAVVENSVTGEVSDDYKIANIIGIVNCIDYDNSELEYFPDGGVMFFDKLVLDENKIKGLLIFRLYDFLPIIVVHKKIKEIFEKNSISGIKFYLPEEYVV